MISCGSLLLGGVEVADGEALPKIIVSVLAKIRYQARLMNEGTGLFIGNVRGRARSEWEGPAWEISHNSKPSRSGGRAPIPEPAPQ